ncbi:MAG: diphthine--ammonia ligase [Clostridium sp.]|uniref:Dph6-related ATP pyrophosphatase n=1 Tax=Clostridium sp. TaxID=1506 RepID=UPI003F2AE8DB
MNRDFVMAFSCGKDSTIALYELIQKGYNPKCLLVTTPNGTASWFHGVNKDLILQISKSLDIDVYFLKCNMETYTDDFVKGLKKIKEIYDVSFCGFGDIDIKLHRHWDEEVSEKSGLKCILPLWNRNREEVVSTFLNLGFKCIIKKLDISKLNESYLGKTLDFETIENFKKDGIDVCGENGEYHTFVFDGPLFKEKISFDIGQVIRTPKCSTIEIF